MDVSYSVRTSAVEYLIIVVLLFALAPASDIRDIKSSQPYELLQKVLN